ncbi:MAG: hypothetical protein GX633_06905 [Clostridiales bacterium]|jgi:hypothetical protein|nr:hypothetical protein [Clostridiales bacterium]
MDAKIKEYIAMIKEKAISVGKAAGKKADDVAKQAKLNIKIFDTNTEIDAIYKDLGRLVYDVHAGEEVSNETIDSLLTSIDSKKELIIDLKAELADLKNSVVCPCCGKENVKDYAFCPACGTKLECEEECPCDVECPCEEECPEDKESCEAECPCEVECPEDKESCEEKCPCEEECCEEEKK